MTQTAIFRAPDADGFHRLPISSCCQAAVVYYRKDSHLFVQAWDHRIGEEPIYCAACNQRLAAP